VAQGEPAGLKLTWQLASADRAREPQHIEMGIDNLRRKTKECQVVWIAASARLRTGTAVASEKRRTFQALIQAVPKGLEKINRCTVNERSSESSIAICKKLF
jgi:hypothetical protein